METRSRVASYDVQRANAAYEHAFTHGLLNTLKSGQLILGHQVETFEQAFATYCGVRHCIGVGNGLDALTLALRAIGVKPGDEVIVPAFTFVATWFSVSQIGACPVPVDVLDDGTIDPAGLSAAVTAKTRAIVPVHLFGRLADMDAIMAAADGLPVVEDAAQAHGAKRTGRSAGAFGTLAAFSFYPTKNLGALGDGGAVTCNDDDLAHRVRLLSNYGSDRKYHHEVCGQNSRLDALQACFLAAKLPDLDSANLRRRQIAARYEHSFHGLDQLACPDRGSDDMVWHQYVIRTPERDQLQTALMEHGIGSAIHYPVAPFDQPCYVGRYDRLRFPVASRLARTVLSLPMAAYLSDIDVETVAGAVHAVAPQLSTHSHPGRLSAGHEVGADRDRSLGRTWNPQ